MECEICPLRGQKCRALKSCPYEIDFNEDGSLNLEADGFWEEGQDEEIS